MTLSAQSLEWAAQFVADHSDGDLFPRIAEISAIIARKSEFAGDAAAEQQEWRGRQPMQRLPACHSI